MQIVSLIIYSTKDGNEIRTIDFNPTGLSLIVDETIKGNDENNKSGSSIGKTCLLKVIDLCLGANDVGILYKNDSGISYQSLKEYINNQKISAKLILKNIYGNSIILERNIFEKGKQYINGESYPLIKEFRSKLKDMMFPDSNDLTFRNLIPFFVSYQKNPIFRFLGTNIKYTQYQSIYSYLLQIAQPSDIKKLEDEKDSLKKKNKTLLHGFKSIEEFEKKIEQDEIENNKLRKEITEFNSVSKEFDKDDSSNLKLQQELDEETDNYYSLKDEEEILNEKINKEKKDIFGDKVVLKALYNETSSIFNNLSKSFDDLVNFHNSMCELRIKNYQNKLDEVKGKIMTSSSRLSELRSTYESKFTNFKFKVNEESNSKFEQYYQKKMEIKNMREDLQNYKSNLEKINGIEQSLNQIASQKESNESQKEKIKKMFDELAFKFSTKETHLEFDFKSNSLPLKINSQNSSGGDGDQKCFIAALMFTVGQVLSEKYDSPKFIIQDAMEQVPLISLRKIFDYARSSKFQYILPILKDRVSSLDINEKEIVLKLSNKDKLFKFETT